MECILGGIFKVKWAVDRHAGAEVALLTPAGGLASIPSECLAIDWPASLWPPSAFHPWAGLETSLVGRLSHAQLCYLCIDTCPDWPDLVGDI